MGAATSHPYQLVLGGQAPLADGGAEGAADLGLARRTIASPGSTFSPGRTSTSRTVPWTSAVIQSGSAARRPRYLLANPVE